MKYNFAIALLIPMFLSGCAFLQSLDGNLPEHIDDMVKQQQYGKALEIITYIKPSNKNYAELMKKKQKINLLIKQLEEDTLNKSKAFINKQEWRQALLTYDSALEKVPDNEKIIKARESFLKKRENYLNELRVKLMVHKGTWLIEATPIITEMGRVAADIEEISDSVQQLEQDKALTLKELAACPQAAIAMQDFNLARQCLTLAEKMDKEKRFEKQLAPARTSLKEYEKQQQQAQYKIVLDLIGELKHGYSHDNLMRASRQLFSLEPKKKLDPRAAELHKELQLLLDEGITQSFEAGRKSYSEGKVEEALTIWTALRDIAPENEELEAHINRAIRVLKKLERLSIQGPTVAPPKNNNASRVR